MARRDALTSTSMPDRILSLPRDARGFPIPFTVIHVAGQAPDFRVLDTEKWWNAVIHRRCGICGEPHDDTAMTFVGGESCRTNRLFLDAPLHTECATYAAQLCPFIAGHSTYSQVRPNDPRHGDAQVVELAAVAPTRPDDMYLFATTGYELIRTAPGQVLLRAEPFISVTRIEPGEKEVPHAAPPHAP